MIGRRELRFASLTEAAADAERLLATGYTAAGKWSLSQACDHLTDWLTYSVDGFPRMPVVLRPVFWLLRTTVGRRKYETYIREQSFPAGKPTMPLTVHPPGDDANAVRRYREAVERFERHDGPIHPSPLFGPLTKDEARALHAVHAAHHLSFLSPK